MIHQEILEDYEGSIDRITYDDDYEDRKEYLTDLLNDQVSGDKDESKVICNDTVLKTLEFEATKPLAKSLLSFNGFR